jgi:hypothetical protein
MHMIQPVGVTAQTGPDITQTDGAREPGVEHRDEMASVGEVARGRLGPVFLIS